MRKNNFQFYGFNALPFALCTLLLFFSGCIRLTGGAGVWKQGPEDEEPVTHQVGFDTQQILPKKNHANITT